MKLLIFSHTYFKDSKVNRALLESLKGKDIAVRNLDELYDKPKFDIQKEHELLSKADEIFIQFPMFWYSSPALFKSWQDEVLTPLYETKPLKKTVKFIITTAEKRYRFDDLDLGCIKGLERFYFPQKYSFLMCGADTTSEIFSICGDEFGNLPIAKYHEFLGV